MTIASGPLPVAFSTSARSIGIGVHLPLAQPREHLLIARTG